LAEKVWQFLSRDLSGVDALCARYAIPRLAAAVLAARDTSPQQIEELLGKGAGQQLFDPLLMRDMDRAAAAVREAVENGELICVCGDYDCDGVAATAIVSDYLTQIGARVCYHIPSREKEGYGLSKRAVRELADYGVRLLLTVDNGISAIEEVAYANSLGLRVVITDHHEPQEILPEAIAVVDPHRADCAYPYKELCGAGVVFKLLCALEGETGFGLLEAYGDLLAIATIADVVELSGENRIFVRRGLELLRESERCGVQTLLGVAGIAGKTLSAESVAFGLAPRINAAGRVNSAEMVVELLLTERESEAVALSEQLNSFNEQRRELEKVVIDGIAAQLAANPTLQYERVIVIDGEGWNAGIIGIVCSRLVERFDKPCVIIARDGELARGSGRSVDGFSLIDAISACSHLLTRYGGHPMAAGFSLMSEDISAFRAALEAYAAETAPEMPSVSLRIDCVVPPALLSVEEVRGLSLLEPFGRGNDMPVFAVCGAVLERVIPLSEGRHCKLRLSVDDVSFFVLCFSVRPEQLGYAAGDVVDVAFSASINEYRGMVSVSLRLRGICLSGEDFTYFHHARQLYEACQRGERGGNAFLPTRDEAVSIYRGMRALGRTAWVPELLYRRICGDTSIDFVHFCVCVEAFVQLEILRRENGMIEINSGAAKTDFGAAPIIRRLSEYA